MSWIKNKGLLIGFFIAIAIILGLLYSGYISERPNYIQDSSGVVNVSIYYLKDTRTDICFATTYKDRGMGLATVPCEKVESYVEY